MRLPNSAHESQPWRIYEVVPDFRLEDVWALPAQGGADDFATLLEVMASLDPANGESRATRALFSIRFRVGGWLGWEYLAPWLAQRMGVMSHPDTLAAVAALAERGPFLRRAESRLS